MDLLERRGPAVIRHPWETSRAEAVARVIERLELGAEPQVLDIGCGDGFVIESLGHRFEWHSPLAHDPYADEDMIAQLEARNIRFLRHLGAHDQLVDLVLLLDVLEHVEDPGEFLAAKVRPLLRANGKILVTVPAFQCLFTAHDRFLRHFRRYDRAGIATVVTGAGLTVLESGYLFSSLLLPRAIGALRERLAPATARASQGVGDWSQSHLLTRLLHEALCLDNRLCLWAHGRGIDWPGLSVWLICQAR